MFESEAARLAVEVSSFSLGLPQSAPSAPKMAQAGILYPSGKRLEKAQLSNNFATSTSAALVVAGPVKERFPAMHHLLITPAELRKRGGLDPPPPGPTHS